MTLQERIFTRVRIGADGCWLWTGEVNWAGYARFSRWERRFVPTRNAGRVAYELLRWPVPAHLDLDHLCRVRRCVNPSHREPVTRQVNLLRGEGIPAVNAKKTACPLGHPYSGRRRGGRYCGECDRLQAARRRAA